jgi:hypothetical protein
LFSEVSIDRLLRSEREEDRMSEEIEGVTPEEKAHNKRQHERAVHRKKAQVRLDAYKARKEGKTATRRFSIDPLGALSFLAGFPSK